VTDVQKPQPVRPTWRTRIRKFCVVVGLTYLFVVILCMIFENRLIYFPSTAAQAWGEKPDARTVDVHVVSADGTKLHGWWLPPTKPEAGGLMYCHGNGGNLSGLGQFSLRIQDALNGCGVLVFDYPGYGMSEGSPSETGCIAAADAFWKFLTTEQKIDGSRIVLVGDSLGGGVATDLASRVKPRALVLVRTFTTLPEVAKDRYPFLPVKMLMRTQFASAAKLERVQAPVFIAHGTADTLVRPRHAEGLFAAAKEPKTLYWMDGADHNDSLTPGFLEALKSFLNAHAP
jgi:fermentation-respiration switch protein FrsA (DUF1100 family)